MKATLRLVAYTALVVSACRREAPASRYIDQRGHWSEVAVQHLAAGDCRAALAGLEGVSPAERIANWFVLAAQAHSQCFLAGKGAAHRADAFRVLDEGMQRYPRSALLVMWKSSVYYQTGEPAIGERYLREAAAIAEGNIASDKTGSGSREDREVLASVQRTIQSRGKTVSPER